jgi:hypothetical protein
LERKLTKVIIDTCVWIELAEKPPLYPLLAELGKLSSIGVFQLVLPTPIFIEFQRNRSRTLEKWAKSFDSHKSVDLHGNLTLFTP